MIVPLAPANAAHVHSVPVACHAAELAQQLLGNPANFSAMLLLLSGQPAAAPPLGPARESSNLTQARADADDNKKTPHEEPEALIAAAGVLVAALKNVQPSAAPPLGSKDAGLDPGVSSGKVALE